MNIKVNEQNPIKINKDKFITANLFINTNSITQHIQTDNLIIFHKEQNIHIVNIKYGYHNTTKM